MQTVKKISAILLFLVVSHPISAKIWTPSILSDNMVLQQNANVKIWGWTTQAAEQITVTGSWNNIPVSIDAVQGSWSVALPTPNAAGPYTITIKGHETLEIKNVLIGEVWLASGQSNMEWTPLYGLDNADEELKNANYPTIRFFQVFKHIAPFPQEDLYGEWVECSPETLKSFSSVAYFFGRNLHQKLSMPVGLINASWGGTPIETWINKKKITTDKALHLAATKISGNKWRPHESGLAFNAMIAPLVNFEIAGCIWYQGESNRVNAHSYYKSFPLLITSWREQWGKEFPFYFVQIAPFDYKDPKNVYGAALVRDAQLYTMLNVSNTGMVVTNDIGNIKNIHPTNKQEVGKRLALWALAKNYGKVVPDHSGPIYRSMKIDKNKIVLHFDHAKNGLLQKGKRLTHFLIAGEDQKFYNAKAKIVDNTVVVSAKEVKKPKAVRFAFDDTAEPNLFNSEGLPATAFRTDTWTIQINQ